jgi:predicted secreted protein
VATEPGRHLPRDVPYPGANGEVKERALDKLMRQWSSSSDLDPGASDPAWRRSSEKAVRAQLADENTRRLQMARSLHRIYTKRAEEWGRIAESLEGAA